MTVLKNLRCSWVHLKPGSMVVSSVISVAFVGGLRGEFLGAAVDVLGFGVRPVSKKQVMRSVSSVLEPETFAPISRQKFWSSSLSQ